MSEAAVQEWIEHYRKAANERDALKAALEEKGKALRECQDAVGRLKEELEEKAT